MQSRNTEKETDTWCLERRASRTVLTSQGHPVVILRSLYDDSHVKTRITQYESLNNGKHVEIAKTLLLSKFEGQNRLLSKCGLRRLDYFHLTEKIKSFEGKDMRSLRTRLTNIEGHCAEKYFEEVFGLFNEAIRPKRRKCFKSFYAVTTFSRAPSLTFSQTRTISGLLAWNSSRWT